MGLADDAVNWPTPPLCPPFEPVKPAPVPEWQRLAAEYSDTLFNDLIRPYIERELRLQHERDWTLAALWWGVHR